MPKKSRRDLILKFVHEDPVLKQQIVKDIKDSEKLEVKADFSEDDGFGSERAESSEEKLVVSDLSCGGLVENVDKEVANMAAVTTESDDNFDETKEERLDQQTGVSNVDLTNRCPDPDQSGTKMMDPKPKEDSCARKAEIEGSYSSDKKEEPAASDTDVFEDDEDEEEEEWEYEWEEGEDNEYEFMEQSEDEDDYTVESFAGSFSISVSK